MSAVASTNARRFSTSTCKIRFIRVNAIITPPSTAPGIAPAIASPIPAMAIKVAMENIATLARPETVSIRV